MNTMNTMIHNLTDSIEQVGTNYEGASGLINFMENGDIILVVALTFVLTLETQMTQMADIVVTASGLSKMVFKITK